MELRIGYLRIILSVEKTEKKRKKENPLLQIKNKRNVYVDRNAVNGITNIFLYPNR